MTSEQQKKAKEIAEKLCNMTDEELLNLPEVDDQEINAFVDEYMQFLDDHCQANFNKSFKEVMTEK
jgi:hypothetical protein